MVALRGNGYPSSFIRSAVAARAPREEVTVEESTTQEEEKAPLAFRLTPEDARFNRDSRYELPDCRITTLHRLGGGVGTKQTPTLA